MRAEAVTAPSSFDLPNHACLEESAIHFDEASIFSTAEADLSSHFPSRPLPARQKGEPSQPAGARRGREGDNHELPPYFRT